MLPESELPIPLNPPLGFFPRMHSRLCPSSLLSLPSYWTIIIFPKTASTIPGVGEMMLASFPATQFNLLTYSGSWYSFNSFTSPSSPPPPASPLRPLPDFLTYSGSCYCLKLFTLLSSLTPPPPPPSLYIPKLIFDRWIGEKYDGIRFCWNSIQRVVYPQKKRGEWGKGGKK